MLLRKFWRRKDAALTAGEFEATELTLREIELKTALEETHRSAVVPARQSMSEVFTRAAHYSPLPGPERDTLVASFQAAVARLSDPDIYNVAFTDGSNAYTFGSGLQRILRDVAQNSRIPDLRNSAVEGIAALRNDFDSFTTLYDINFLTGLTREEDASRRIAALRGLVVIATKRDLHSLPSLGLSNFPGGYDIRDAYDFARKKQGSYVSCEEFILCVAAHVLRNDPETAVRVAAAQALRDIAAANRPKHQFLAASYVAEALPLQQDAGVRAAIEAVFEDSRTVNFARHQKIPGVAGL